MSGFWKEEHVVAILDGHAEALRLLLDDAIATWNQWSSGGRKKGNLQNQAEGKFNLYICAACHSIEIALKTLRYQDKGRSKHPGKGGHEILPIYSSLRASTKDALDTIWGASYDASGKDVSLYAGGTPLFRRGADDETSLLEVLTKASKWNNLFRFEIFERKVSYEEVYGYREHLSDAVQVLRFAALDRSPQGEGLSLKRPEAG